MDDHEKILHIFDQIINNFHSGILALVTLQTIRGEYQRFQNMEDDIFIATLVVSTYNTVVLALANTMKPSSDSIHIDYMFNIIRNSKNSLQSETYDQLISFIDEFDAELRKISSITDHVIHLRDTTVAHLDRKHVNNPASLIQTPPVSWDDLHTAYTLIGSGLLEMGEILGTKAGIEDYLLLSNFTLAEKTKQVFRLLYGLG